MRIIMILEDFWSVRRQVALSVPYQVSMRLVFSELLANRLAALKRLQHNPELAGRR